MGASRNEIVRAICEKRNLYKNNSGTFFQYLPNDLMDKILTSTIHKEIIKGVELDNAPNTDDIYGDTIIMRDSDIQPSWIERIEIDGWIVMKWNYSNDGTRREEANFILNYISCIFDLPFVWIGTPSNLDIDVKHNGKLISLRKELEGGDIPHTLVFRIGLDEHPTYWRNQRYCKVQHEEINFEITKKKGGFELGYNIQNKIQHPSQKILRLLKKTEWRKKLFRKFLYGLTRSRVLKGVPELTKINNRLIFMDLFTIHGDDFFCYQTINENVSHLPVWYAITSPDSKEYTPFGLEHYHRIDDWTWNKPYIRGEGNLYDSPSTCPIKKSEMLRLRNYYLKTDILQEKIYFLLRMTEFFPTHDAPNYNLIQTMGWTIYRINNIEPVSKSDLIEYIQFVGGDPDTKQLAGD